MMHGHALCGLCMPEETRYACLHAKTGVGSIRLVTDVLDSCFPKRSAAANGELAGEEISVLSLWRSEKSIASYEFKWFSML